MHMAFGLLKLGHKFNFEVFYKLVALSIFAYTRGYIGLLKLG
jgi:hypothetical protein